MKLLRAAALWVIFQRDYKGQSRIVTTRVSLPFQRFITCVTGEETVDCEAPNDSNVLLLFINFFFFFALMRN